jgi:hypothetical protein
MKSLTESPQRRSRRIGASQSRASGIKAVVASGNRAFALTIFLSAFLLFQVQLIVGKQLLPWFGGTPAVWITCMVFFQLLLLAGYSYAHLVSSRLKAKPHAYAHAALLLTAAGALVVSAFFWLSPIYPGTNWRPADSSSPVLHILALLSVSVGLPFFLLSTTSPLMQTWFAVANPQGSPYRLYALSNLGSLLGLLTYPVVVEPNLTLRNQGRIWAVLFFVFGSACAFCALRHARSGGPIIQNSPKKSADQLAAERPNWTQRLLWFGLSACGCAMLLAITNLMCQEIASVAFLWVLPLSIFLLSFVLCFNQKPLYWRWLFFPLFFAAVGWSAVISKTMDRLPDPLVQIASLGFLLFVACMVYHGELATLKPSPRHLTSYYFFIALGGAAGSVLVGLIAPHVFPAFWEFPIVLVGSGLLVGIVLLRDRSSWLYEHPGWLMPVTLLFIAGLADYVLLSTRPPVRVYLHVILVLAAPIAGMIVSGRIPLAHRPRALQAVLLCGWCMFGLLFWYSAHAFRSKSVYMSRNLYGVLTVFHFDPMRFVGSNLPDPRFSELRMVHGATDHGSQFQQAGRRRVPTTYYAPNSGIGLLLANLPIRNSANPEERNMRLGVVGLGVGTLAAYGEAGDYIRFYEINPDVIRLAEGPEALFTFIKDSPAHIETALGDGRVSLERELASGHSQNFDVLVLDAFSSDSIPVHLLTREAMAVYLHHLRGPRSILAFHITNRTLDLRPVLAGLAHEYKLQLIQVHSNDPDNDMGHASDWVLMAADGRGFNVPVLLQRAALVEAPDPPLWTDDYSNLWQVLK